MKNKHANDDDIDLGDFIGHLLSEITRARTQADMESVRVAEVYASHPLLKHFPIPRVRLPEVELDLPVMLTELPEICLEDHEKESQDKETVDEKNFNLVLQSVLSIELSNLRIPLSSVNSIKKIAAQRVKAILEKSPSTRFGSLLTQVTRTIASQLNLLVRRRQAKLTTAMINSFNERVKEKVETQYYSSKNNLIRSSGVKVLPHTSKVREVGERQYLTNFKLKITEDAVEWSRTEGETADETEGILVPE